MQRRDAWRWVVGVLTLPALHFFVCPSFLPALTPCRGKGARGQRVPSPWTPNRPYLRSTGGHARIAGTVRACSSNLQQRPHSSPQKPAAARSPLSLKMALQPLFRHFASRRLGVRVPLAPQTCRSEGLHRCPARDSVHGLAAVTRSSRRLTRARWPRPRVGSLLSDLSCTRRRMEGVRRCHRVRRQLSTDADARADAETMPGSRTTMVATVKAWLRRATG